MTPPDTREWRVIVLKTDPARPVACVKLDSMTFPTPAEDAVNVVPISRLAEVEKERDRWVRAFNDLGHSVVEHFGALPGDYDHIREKAEALDVAQ